MNVFLNIGSNLGNRRMHLSRAIAAIEKEFGFFELSHTVESAPWGYSSANDYLNVGMMVVSDLAPEEILGRLQKIEGELNAEPHRNADGTYRDREVDIDIIAIDEIEYNTPQLQLPHPRMAERRFVLEPMAELAPFWRHPASGLTPAEMLATLESRDQGQ
ncbi:MAG: 2-amino-4-hydroxy-6-hydroxymethyldihydropteridine diphosphokinase [Muribaculaceae bacterium]|nr:2-amino-4-hydroxy-6-hydroxymethyldihydropteridine diphosphokinase [Muribaculaceae bacterium]